MATTSTKRKKKRFTVPIHSFLSKFPGGNIIIPLLIGCIVMTVSSHLGHPNIWAELGDPMELLFSGKKGLMGFIGLMLFFTGTQTDVTKLKSAFKRSLPLLALRIAIAYGATFGLLAIFGTEGFLGISFLGITAVLTCFHAVMFMAITNSYADDADRAYFSISIIFALPIFPLLTVMGAKGAPINYLSIVSIVLPLILGMVLGNLDPKMRNLYAAGNSVIIMFMGFQFGSYIDLTKAVYQIPQALLLILMLYLTVIPAFLVERFVMKRPGYNAIGLSAMAGVALSLPELARSVYGDVVADNTTYQLAFVLIVTSILAPILTDLVNRSYYKSNPLRLQAIAPNLYFHMEVEIHHDDMEKEAKIWRQAFRWAKKHSEGLDPIAQSVVAKAHDLKEEGILDREAKETIYSHLANQRKKAFENLKGKSRADIQNEVLSNPYLDTHLKEIRQAYFSKETPLQLPLPEERAKRAFKVYETENVFSLLASNSEAVAK